MERKGWNNIFHKNNKYKNVNRNRNSAQWNTIQQ